LQGLASVRQSCGADFPVSRFIAAATKDESGTVVDLFLMAQPAESRARGAIQELTGRDGPGFDLPQPAGERASVSGQRNVAGGRLRE